MQPARKVSVPQWEAQSGLIGDIPPYALALLDRLPEALERVWPLSKAHRRRLPADIRDLSAMLTSQRSELRFNYWKKPNWISAYLYYFLPWNLVRLCRLLPALPLPAPSGNALLADAGSGPLTLPLALWLAMPAWRPLPVTALALDATKQPLELGAALFEELSQLAGEPGWQSRLATGPLESLEEKSAVMNGTPWLGAAANVLNELRPGKHEAAASDRFDRLLEAWQPLWQNGAPLLFVEPGTRLGGALIMRMRSAALELGLYPLAPCTHTGPCPLPERDDPAKLPSGWCHFVFSAQEAPVWLKKLSQEARLFKTSLSISLLMLSNSASRNALPDNALPVRVISQSFLAQMSVARYGCAACGLSLLRNSRNALSGSLCLARKTHAGKRDAKSGALILEPYACGDNRDRLPNTTR